MRLEEIIGYIQDAKPEEIHDLLDAIANRYREVFPQWDLNIFVLPMGDRESRRKCLNQILELAEKYGNL